MRSFAVRALIFSCFNVLFGSASFSMPFVFQEFQDRNAVLRMFGKLNQETLEYLFQEWPEQNWSIESFIELTRTSCSDFLQKHLERLISSCLVPPGQSIDSVETVKSFNNALWWSVWKMRVNLQKEEEIAKKESHQMILKALKANPKLTLEELQKLPFSGSFPKLSNATFEYFLTANNLFFEALPVVSAVKRRTFISSPAHSLVLEKFLPSVRTLGEGNVWIVSDSAQLSKLFKTLNQYRLDYLRKTYPEAGWNEKNFMNSKDPICLHCKKIEIMHIVSDVCFQKGSVLNDEMKKKALELLNNRNWWGFWTVLMNLQNENVIKNESYREIVKGLKEKGQVANEKWQQSFHHKSGFDYFVKLYQVFSESLSSLSALDLQEKKALYLARDQILPKNDILLDRGTGETVLELFKNWTEETFFFLNERHFEGRLSPIAFEAKAKLVFSKDENLAMALKDILTPASGTTKNFLFQLFLCRIGALKRPQDLLSPCYTDLILSFINTPERSLDDIMQDERFQKISPDKLRLLFGAHGLLMKALELSDMTFGNKNLKKLSRSHSEEKWTQSMQQVKNEASFEDQNQGVSHYLQKSQSEHRDDLDPKPEEMDHGQVKKVRSCLKSTTRNPKKRSVHFRDEEEVFQDAEKQPMEMEEEEEKNVKRTSHDKQDFSVSVFISNMNQFAIQMLRETFPNETFTLADLQENVVRLDIEGFLKKAKKTDFYPHDRDGRRWLGSWKKVHFLFDELRQLEKCSDLFFQIPGLLKKQKHPERRDLKFPYFQKPLSDNETVIAKIKEAFNVKSYHAKRYAKYFEENSVVFKASVRSLFDQINQSQKYPRDIIDGFHSFHHRFKSLFNFSKSYFDSIREGVGQEGGQKLLSFSRHTLDFLTSSEQESSSHFTETTNSVETARRGRKKASKKKAETRGKTPDTKHRPEFLHLSAQSQSEGELDGGHSKMINEESSKNMGVQTRKRTALQRLSQKTSESEEVSKRLIEQSAATKTRQEEQSAESRFKQQRLNSKPGEGKISSKVSHVSHADVSQNTVQLQNTAQSQNTVQFQNTAQSQNTAQNIVFENDIVIPQKNTLALNDTSREMMQEEEIVEEMGQHNRGSRSQHQFLKGKQESRKISPHINNAKNIIFANNVSHQNTLVVNHSSVLDGFGVNERPQKGTQSLSVSSADLSKWTQIDEHNKNSAIRKNDQGRFMPLMTVKSEHRESFLTVYQMGELFYKQFQTKLYDIALNPYVLRPEEDVFLQIHHQICLRFENPKYSFYECSAQELDPLALKFRKLQEHKNPWALFSSQNRSENYTTQHIVHWSACLYYLVFEQPDTAKKGEAFLPYPMAQKIFSQQQQRFLNESRSVAQYSFEGWVKQKNVVARKGPPLKTRGFQNVLHTSNSGMTEKSPESSIEDEAQEQAELDILQNLFQYALEEVRKYVSSSQTDFENLSNQMDRLSFNQKQLVSNQVAQVLKKHHSHPFWDKIRFIIPAWFKYNHLTMTAECENIETDFKAKYRLEKQKTKEAVFRKTIRFVQNIKKDGSLHSTREQQ